MDECPICCGRPDEGGHSMDCSAVQPPPRPKSYVLDGIESTESIQELRWIAQALYADRCAWRARALRAEGAHP